MKEKKENYSPPEQIKEKEELSYLKYICSWRNYTLLKVLGLVEIQSSRGKVFS